MRRRTWLGSAWWTAWAAMATGPGVAARQPAHELLPFPLQFPRDHGAHPQRRTEWWYVTGALQTESGQALGFQITFFRSRVAALATNDPAGALPRRFEPAQLLFAHGALSDLAAQRQWHAERLARWNGRPDARPAYARLDDTDVAIGPWRLRRLPGQAVDRYQAWLEDAGFGFELLLTCTQPLLLQGQGGLSRKGPQASQASAYYSQPQLAVSGTVRRGAQRSPVTGTAWLDHEWSESLLHPDAVGWDWIGMNLDDGSALTAFQLRRADGSALWAGGSWRAPGGQATRAFRADEVRFTPLHHWLSPASGARYPLHWRVDTPTGPFLVKSRLDAQELDSRRSTGAIYWEGLSELRAADGGQRLGLGYLELTGYGGRLAL